MIGGASGCGLCPWSSSRKVGAYAQARGVCAHRALVMLTVLTLYISLYQ